MYTKFWDLLFCFSFIIFFTLSKKLLLSYLLYGQEILSNSYFTHFIKMDRTSWPCSMYIYKSVIGMSSITLKIEVNLHFKAAFNRTLLCGIVLSRRGSLGWSRSYRILLHIYQVYICAFLIDKNDIGIDSLKLSPYLNWTPMLFTFYANGKWIYLFISMALPHIGITLFGHTVL